MRLDIPSARLDRPAGDRSVWFRLCTRDVDRHGTVIEPAGVILDAFHANPVFCWMHPLAEPEGAPAPGPERVIGRVTAIEQSQDVLDFCVRFAEHELAQLCYEQVLGGYLGAVSIFGTTLATETREIAGKPVMVYTALELVEASLVIAGSNKAALRLNRAVQRALQARTRRGHMTKDDLASALGMPGDATRKVIAARLAELRAAMDEHYPKEGDGEGEGGGEAPKDEPHEEPDGDEAVKKEAARLAAGLRSEVDGLIKAGRLPASDAEKWRAHPALALGVARSFSAGTFTTSQRLHSGNVGTVVVVEETEETDQVKSAARSLLAKARGERPDRPALDVVQTTAAQLIKNARGQARG